MKKGIWRIVGNAFIRSAYRIVGNAFIRSAYRIVGNAFIRSAYCLVVVILISSFFLTASTFNYQTDDEIVLSTPTNFRSVEIKHPEDQRTPICGHRVRNCTC